MSIGNAASLAGLNTERSFDQSQGYVRRYNPQSGETIALSHPIVFYDDFLGGTLAGSWSSPNGVQGTTTMASDGLGGRALLIPGALGIMTNDIAMLMLDTPFYPSSSYDINLEVRLGVDASGPARIGVGFTDADTSDVQEPSELDDEDTLIVSVVDGAGFLLNEDGASPANWHLWAAAYGDTSLHVKSNDDSTLASSAMQVLRIRLNRAGYVSGWIDGVKVFDHQAHYGSCLHTVVDSFEDPSVDPTQGYRPYIYTTYPLGASPADPNLFLDYVRVWAGR